MFTNNSRDPASSLLKNLPINRGMAFGVIIITALLAFEIFNYSTTDFALTDLLGDLRFAGLRWATILSIAFCGIDFAGIARLFTPDGGSSSQNETWYLFGAWLLAATMNAMLTWWGVSLAIINHNSLGNAVIERQILLRVVPIFVAILVWLIRVLIIGTFSVAGEHLFELAGEQPRQSARSAARPAASSYSRALNRPSTSAMQSAAPRRSNSRAASAAPATASSRTTRVMPPPPEPPEPVYARAEPTYHPFSANAAEHAQTSETAEPISPRQPVLTRRF